MKNTSIYSILFIIVLFISCEKSIDKPKQLELYNGFYFYGNATPFATIETNASGVNGDAVGKASKFLRLTTGEILISLEDNSTSKQKNSIAFGLDENGKLVKNGLTFNFSQVPGDYLIQMDTSTRSITIKEILNWGVIGDASPGGWTDDTKMSLETYENGIYTYTCNLHLFGGKAIKFRANGGWDINMGGAETGMTLGGDNINITEEGDYVVKLKLGTKYTYSVMKN